MASLALREESGPPESQDGDGAPGRGPAAVATAVYDLGPIELVSGTGAKGQALALAAAGGRPAAGSAGHAPVRSLGRAGERSYAIVLLTGGTARLQHYGHVAVLAPGDFALVNAAAPHGLDFLTAGAFVMLRVAPADLRAYLPSCEHLCGRPLRSGEGISQGSAELVQSILAQLELGFEPEFRNRIARNLLDTLATAFSIVLDRELDGSPIICDRNARVRLYIESNLRDPELKPSTIAANLRISPRYMRVIFAASRETVSAYILRRRLEECARDLADRALGELSITEIAFSWGFNSGPHFTRSFRARFGRTPREHRARS